MATVTGESLGLSNLTPDQMAAAQQPTMGYNTQAALTPIYSGQSSYFGTPQITGYSGADGTQYNAQGQVTGAASLNGQVYSFDPSTGAVTYQAKADGGGFGQLLGIAAAIALPGIGEALAPTIMGLADSAGIVLSETAAASVGSAAASVAVQTAQGVPLDKAIENAGVNLLVQTQSQPAVQALNASIGSPAVASAITSATGSAITAAAQGKSADQIAQAAAGGAIGGATGAALGTQGATDIPGVTTPSAIQSALDVTPTQASNLGTALASTLGTALGTGSTQATLASLAGQLGSGNLNSILPGETGTGGTVSDVKASASPYTRTGAIGSQAVVPTDSDVASVSTSTTTPNVNVSGTSDNVVPTATSTTSPNVTVTAPTNANVATANTTTQLINQLGLSNPPATTSPTENVTVTGTKDNTVPVSTTTTPTGTNYGNVTVTGERIIPTDQGTVTVTDSRIPVTDYGNVDVTGQRISTPDYGNVTITDTLIPTSTPNFLPQTVESSEVKNVDVPDVTGIPVSITGGPAKKAKTPAPAISAGPRPSTGTTEGLTGGDLGGEIQAQETGGRRQDVWNESSLRLRDALGLG